MKTASVWWPFSCFFFYSIRFFTATNAVSKQLRLYKIHLSNQVSHSNAELYETCEINIIFKKNFQKMFICFTK